MILPTIHQNCQISASASRILIIEGDLIVAADIHLILSHNGYNVIDIASSGEKAVDAVTCFDPDLIVMDIDSRRHADDLKYAVYFDIVMHQRVLVMTTSIPEDMAETGFIGLLHGIILKPFDEQKLLQSVEYALHHSAA